LTAANFDAHLSKNTRTLLKVYAPWCGHCKELEPKFEEAARQLKGTGVSLAKVDATEHTEIKDRYNVEGYPRLLWLEDGQHSDYSGERTTEDIVKWVRFMIRPPVIEGQEPGEPGKLPNVVLHAPELYEGFEAAAKARRSTGVWHFVRDASGRPPRIVVQHAKEEPIEMQEYLRDKDAIEAFFAKHEVPLFGVLDGATFARYDGKGLVWSLFPIDHEAGGLDAHEAMLRPTMMEVAVKFAGKYCVTYTDTDMFREQIDNMLGVKEFPAIVVQPKAGSKQKYMHSGNMTSSAIIDFLERVGAGEVAPLVKSEAVPEADAAPVKVLVGSTLPQEAFQPDRDVLVKIMAPWCGACKAMWPEYKKLGQYVRQWELSEFVTIAKIDATANDLPESMPYSSFPTVYFVPAGSSEPVKYEGGRTSKEMWQWLKQRSTRGAEIKRTQARVRAKKEKEKSEL